MTRRDSDGLFAPGYGSSDEWLRVPGPNDPLPGVDERLVAPETRAEILHGIELFAAPAQPPHAMQHFDLAYVLGAHVAEGFRGALDMLTRTGHTSDFAPDASVFSTELDPKTGTRKLEDLAFEVCDEQPLGVPTEKARELVKRGVRRVFCLVVKHQRVLEWNREADSWQTMLEDAVIEDKCFVKPLPTRALLDAMEAEDAVVEALQARKGGALHELLQAHEVVGREEGREEARRKGRNEGLLLAARNMLDAGDSVDRVAKVLGLSSDVVRGLLSKW